MSFNSTLTSDFLRSVAYAKDCDLELVKFLNYPDVRNAFSKLLDQISNFDLADQIKLHRYLEAQVEAYKALPLPKEYLKFINDVHSLAWPKFLASPVAQELLPKWKKKIAPLIVNDGRCTTVNWDLWYDWEQKRISERAKELMNREGLSAHKCFALLNVASSTVHEAWQECLNTKTQTPPLIFEPFPNAGSGYPGGIRENSGALSFPLCEHDLAMLDFRWLIHLAFHEPHHAIQRCISKKAVDIDNIPEKYGKAFCQMDALLTVGGLWPHTTFCVTTNVDLDNIAFAAYRQSPNERMAHQQGYLAELAFSKEFEVALDRQTSDTICNDLSCYKALSSDLKEWFLKEYLRPFIHKDLDPNRPKLLVQSRISKGHSSP